MGSMDTHEHGAVSIAHPDLTMQLPSIFARGTQSLQVAGMEAYMPAGAPSRPLRTSAAAAAAATPRKFLARPEEPPQ